MAPSFETVERVTPGTDSWRMYGHEHLQRYEYFASAYKGKKVLDAACGTGYGTHYISTQGAASVLGLDISEEAIGYCTKHYTGPGLEYRRYNLSQLSRLEEQFDVIVSFETVEHLADPALFIADAAKLLKPGGLFICSMPNKKRHSDSGGINPFHLNELPWEDFKNLFEKHFLINGCFHQSENISYLRYMELRHLVHQEHARSNAFLFNRLELFLRRILKRPFRPIPFYHTGLDIVQPEEIRIEQMSAPEDWHKTFIFSGTKKN